MESLDVMTLLIDRQTKKRYFMLIGIGNFNQKSNVQSDRQIVGI